MARNRTITHLLTIPGLEIAQKSVDFRVEIALYFRVNGAKSDGSMGLSRELK
jgi:hypothetical protein